MIDSDNRLYHKWQNKPNGRWVANWGDLGGDWPSNSNPAVVQNEDGRLEVFLIGNTGRLYHKWQKKPNGGWVANWGDLEGDWTPYIVPPAVGRNEDGRLEVFTLNSGNRIDHRWQTRPNGRWSETHSLGSI